MMKRKILAVVLPIVGCATVVGSGFSAWYFEASTSDSDSFTANTHVTEEIKDAKGTLDFVSSNSATLDEKYLILDQGGSDDSSRSDATKGIMISDTSVEEITARKNFAYTFKVSYDGTKVGLSLNQVYRAKMELSVVLSIKLQAGEAEAKGLDDYIKVKDSAKVKVIYKGKEGNETTEKTPLGFTTADSGITYTAKYTLGQNELSTLVADSSEVTKYTWEFSLDLSTSDTLVNSLFEYKDKPSDHDTLEAMRTAAEGKTVTFATTASIAPEATN